MDKLNELVMTTREFWFNHTATISAVTIEGALRVIRIRFLAHGKLDDYGDRIDLDQSTSQDIDLTPSEFFEFVDNVAAIAAELKKEETND